MLYMPINSVIGLPTDGENLKTDLDGKINVSGYALPQGADGPVEKVEVSVDHGNSWIEAELRFGDNVGPLKDQILKRKFKWAWCLWSAKVSVEKGTGRSIVCRATDAGGNTQPEQCEWNLRGVAYNGWGRAENLTIS